MDISVSEVTSAAAVETPQQTQREVSNEFYFTLSKVAEEGLAERLSALIDDISKSGKKLADHMDVADLKHYRTLVRDFLNEVVNNSHKFSRENFLDRRGRHRVYGIVKLVNKNLDELAQEVLSKEKDHLRILDKVDEIRGLLLDIFV